MPVTALDAERPVSFSETIVSGLLRGRWSQEGVLVTDDFSMGAVYGSKAGIAAAGVAALNAGVDLILVSYDPDPVFHHDECAHHGRPRRWAGAHRPCSQRPAAGRYGAIID